MAAYRPGLQLPCKGCRVLQQEARGGGRVRRTGGREGRQIPGTRPDTRHRASPVAGVVTRGGYASAGAFEDSRDCGADAVAHAPAGFVRCLLSTKPLQV